MSGSTRTRRRAAARDADQPRWLQARELEPFGATRMVLGTGSATLAGTECSNGSSIGRSRNAKCDSGSTPAQVASNRGSRQPRDFQLIVFPHSAHRFEETRSGERCQEPPVGSRPRNFLPDRRPNVACRTSPLGRMRLDPSLRGGSVYDPACLSRDTSHGRLAELVQHQQVVRTASFGRNAGPSRRRSRWPRRAVHRQFRLRPAQTPPGHEGTLQKNSSPPSPGSLTHA